MFSMLFLTALRPEYMLYCSIKMSEENVEQNENDIDSDEEPAWRL